MLKDRADGLLQSIVDGVGANSNLPLRILDLKALNGLSDADFNLGIESNEPIKEVYKSIVSVLSTDEEVVLLHHLYSTPDDNAPTIPAGVTALSLYTEDGKDNLRYSKSVELLKTLENRVYVNQCSSITPIEELFRLSYEWRWFELIWLYINRHLLIESAVNSNDLFLINDPYLLKGWSLYASLLTYNSDYMLIGGPSFITRQRSDFDQNILKSRELFLEGYCRFQHTFARRGLTKRFAAEDMKRVLDANDSLPLPEVKKRFEISDKVLSYLLSQCSSLTIFQESEQSQNELAKTIANIAFSIGRLSQSRGMIENLIQAFPNQRKGILSRINSKIQSLDVLFSTKLEKNQKGHAYCNIEVSVTMTGTGSIDNWQFESDITFTDKSTHIAKICKVNGKTINKTNGINEEHLSWLNESVSGKIDRWENTANTRRKYSNSLHCKLLGDWLNHQFLTTTTAFIEGVQPTKDTAVYNFLCNYIATTVRADACLAYRYYSHRSAGDLSVLGMSSLTSCWSDIDLGTIKDKMQELSNSDLHSQAEKARQSLVYWVTKNRRSKIIETLHSDLSEDISIWWPEKCDKPRFLLAVPILVEGRIWGVIELAFSSRNTGIQTEQLIVNEFSSVLSVFLFGITYNQNIAQLGYWGTSAELELPGSTKKLANELAERICRINLARAVLIMTRAQGRRGNYKLEGFCGSGLLSDSSHEITLNMEDEATDCYLCSRLYRAFQNDGTSFLCGRLDSSSDDKLINDLPMYYVLGKKYFKVLSQANGADELVLPDARQIVAYTFNVDSGLEQEMTLFGVQLDELSVNEREPTGMVLVYHDEFINRQHWFGVNSDISHRLANCYKEILVNKREIENRGRIIRHEVRHTVKSLEPVVVSIKNSANRIRTFFSKITRELANDETALQRLKVLQVEARRVFPDIAQLTNRNDNFQRLYEQLNAQTESIERADYNEIFTFDGLISDGIDSDQSPLLQTIIRDAITQNSDSYSARNIFVDYTQLPDDIRIRIKPQYLYLLIRNIFDNWGKYTKSRSTCKIELVPKYNPIKPPDFYTLIFSNECTRIDQSVVDETDWFGFGVRHTDQKDSGIFGEGIGLFWIHNILTGKHNIPVDVRIGNSDRDPKTSTFSLRWHLKPHWLSIYAD